MAGLQVRNIPGVSWPSIPRGEVSQLWAMFLELGRTQWLSPQAISSMAPPWARRVGAAEDCRC